MTKEIPVLTARQQGLVSCHFCHTLSRLPERVDDVDHMELRCPCCQSIIHSRIPGSLNKTWALLIAAIILYFPANTLPIMTVILWGNGQPDTIMSGVIHLFDGGMWPLALLIFVASIFIPVLKLIILTGLMISVHLKSSWKPRDRTVLYRITEFVGRWSMVDVFVICILVTLVQFGNTANVSPGIGALSFAAVVILTMFAAHTFDPRLIWDVIEEDKENNTTDLTDTKEITMTTASTITYGQATSNNN
jgi:paraquat-inducible protein A